MSLLLRPFDPSSNNDWEAWVAVRNAALPEYISTMDEMKSSDERRDPRCVQIRALGEVGGQVVGGYSFGQIAWSFHPDRYSVNLFVHPDHEGGGVGRALYSAMLADLHGRGAEAILAMAREDHPRSLRFALDRGFVETMREWESRLDVAAFDMALWHEARTRTASCGIAIKSLAELAADPDRDRKVWGLETETGRDVPSTEEPNDLPFESYRKMVLESPSLIPDAFIIAVDEETGRYVGSSNLWTRQADRDLQTGLTAVQRDYRRKGIALAMKLRVIEYAQSVGAPIIRTENATTNRAMLSINEALGFVKQPVWIDLTNELRPRTPTPKG